VIQANAQQFKNAGIDPAHFGDLSDSALDQLSGSAGLFTPQVAKKPDSFEQGSGALAGLTFNKTTGTYLPNPEVQRVLEEKANKAALQASIDDGKINAKGRQGINKDVTALTSESQGIFAAATSLDDLKANASASSKLAAVFKFMTALDPTSVVRESEQEQVYAATGAAESLAGKINGLLGEGQLTDKAFADIVATAKTLANSSIDATASSVGGYLDAYEDTIPDKFKSLLSKRVPKRFGGAAPSAAKGQTINDAVRLVRMADERGDRDTAMKAMLQIKELRQAPQEAAATQELSLGGKVSDLFTGNSRATQRIEDLPEIGAAPELNELSVPAFKASLGLLATGDTKSLQAMLTKQFGDKVSFEEDEKKNVIVKFPSGEFALNKPGVSGQDLIRGAFDMAALTPAGRALTIPKAAAAAGGTQAGIEAIEGALGGGFDLTDVAFSTLAGGAFKGLEGLIKTGVRLAKSSGASSGKELVEDATDAGIPLLTSDVFPPTTFAGKTAQQITEKIPVIGTGAIREKQQAARKVAVNEVVDSYGEFSYGAVVDSLRSQKDKVKRAAGSVLNSTGAKLDDVGEIPTSNTRVSIEAALEELGRKGVLTSSKAADDIATLSKTIAEAPQTFTTLKENRTAFRDIVNSIDPQAKSQLGTRGKGLMDDVLNSMTDDMKFFARGNLDPSEFAKWQKANAVYASEAQKLTKTKLKNILDKGDVTPEAVQTMLFSRKPSEVRALYQSMGATGRQNARAAIISKIASSRVDLTPTGFAGEVKKNALQVNTFFKGEEKKSLDGLVKALDASKRAQDASVSTPTGQQLIGAVTLGAAATDLFATLGIGSAVGVTARLFESAPVRNALLKLSAAPKGSSSFEKALSELNAILLPSAVAMRNAQQAKE
jgi:hypothetical protein